MGRLRQDLRYGFRTLWQRPGFTLVAALTLALGIGANTAIFSVVNGVLLRSLPYAEPDRLVLLWETSGRSLTIHVSNPNLLDWRERNHSFESFSGYSGRWGGKTTILGGTEPERAFAVAVYRDYFKVLGVAPMIGRDFSAEEQSSPGTTPVAIVSYGFWQRRLGGDPDLSNRKLTLGDTTFNIVGVMPQGFSYPSETDLWLAKEQLGADQSTRSAHNYVGIARLKPGVTVEQAEADMNAIARDLEQQYPNDNRGMGVNVISLEDQLVGQVRPALLVLLAGVGFVLLIACANVSNLLLARALGRQKEIAIRTALGASPWRIVRQLLTESVLLSLLGGSLGLLLAYWLIGPLVALSPGNIPRLDEIRIDARTLLFTLGVSLLTSLIFGLLPAIRFSRPDLQVALKQGGQTPGGGSLFLRHALVVAEVALTMVLLVGAGLLVKSFWRLLQVNPGFNPENVLTMQISLPESAYREDNQTIAFHRRLLERLGALPGVEAAGIINNLPLGGVDINGYFWIEGDPPERPSGDSGFRIVSKDYFRAMNIPLLKGRLFTEQDNEGSVPVGVISERVAEATWPGEDAIGKRIQSRNDDREEWTTIIGIVGDVRHRGLDRAASADLYLPYAQRPLRARAVTVVVRANAAASGLIAAMRSEVQAIDRNVPVEFESMEQVFSRSVASRRYSMLLLGTFAALALILSLMGIYGVMSYTVTQNTREIGIRMALGARELDVLKMIVRRGMALTLLGVAGGVLGAFALTRLMASLLFGVTASDPQTFLLVSVLLVVVALLACYLPARRATKVDPIIALRYE
ncbi:MAG TPA: ABC transporter permease [Pyrinomonadaceae bacterium]|jgi:putative ABC transport system permease protein|nr:ABC transporter permease [Pyrinomonadaceae bacterium]